MPAKRTPGSRSPNDIDIAVGRKLRKLRLDAGMTLQDLADQIGTSHQQLQKYETGVNRISAGMLPIVADVIGTEILEFFMDVEGTKGRRSSAADKVRAECEACLRRTKSEDKLKAMLKVLKALSD
ncbi:helix-turn-helix transcriptional regulator [Hyphomonas sp.]|uniref:helix-turn-helix domain-containing protein n=1 Tax=Hyphomonas sp. TaxID=87 RepID=UPI0025C6ABB2|nr:helix-turn-helix transcriptional regulator [Hyphomonas sp.]MBI1399636.1 helix-turn-helix domain-containing protein [Hyphomonas sp.]